MKVVYLLENQNVYLSKDEQGPNHLLRYFNWEPCHLCSHYDKGRGQRDFV